MPQNSGLGRMDKRKGKEICCIKRKMLHKEQKRDRSTELGYKPKHIKKLCEEIRMWNYEREIRIRMLSKV